MRKLRKIPDTKILTKEQVRRYLYKQEVEEQKIICPVCGKEDLLQRVSGYRADPEYR